MTVWATDENGAVQVEMDKDESFVWLTFNTKTSVLIMTPGEAQELYRELGEVLARKE
jgi:hypothetical protein